MFRHFVLLCLLTLLSIPLTFSQTTTLQILDAHLVLESDNLTNLDTLTEEQLEDMDQAVLDSIFATRQFDVTASVHVSDTGNVQTVHIRIGRTQGGTDVANVSVPYTGALPSGVVAVLKDDEEIEVEFGKHGNVTPLYLEVWIDDKQGNTTAVFQSSNL